MMIEKIQNDISKLIENHHSKKYLLAVSGGVDSMVLLHIFRQLKYSFSVAHCNFGLRGEESEKETIFVQEYCKKHKIDFFVKYFDTKSYSKYHKLSIQVSARELRYQWFYKLLKDKEIDYLVTAHHLNDQIETFFIHSLRATSVNGLRGIPQKNNNIVRPLLNFSRQELLQYAKENQVNWKEDSSNIDTKYVRNKIRHKVIPVLEEIAPNIHQQFLSLFSHLEEDFILKNEYLNELFNQFCEANEEYIVLKWSLLEKEKFSFIKLKHLLVAYGFDNDEEIKKIIQSQSGKSIFSSTHELLKDRNNLLVRKKNEKNNNEKSYVIEKDEQDKRLSLIFAKQFENFNSNILKEVTINADFIQEPLSVRRPKEGDVFQPLGMKGNKKISKYLKDLKLSKYQKENIWLLVDAADNIIWVIGFQIDNKYRINEQTQKTLNIILKR